MNDKQIEIGNDILKLFIEKAGQMTDKEFTNEIIELHGDECRTLTNTTAVSMIEDYTLLRRSVYNKDKKIITANGRKAYEIGLKQFIEKTEKDKDLELELAKSNIKANEFNAEIAKQNKTNKGFNQIATVVNAAIGLINLGIIIWQLVKASN